MAGSLASETTNPQDLIRVVAYHEKPCESTVLGACVGTADGGSKPLFQVNRDSMRHKI